MKRNIAKLLLVALLTFSLLPTITSCASLRLNMMNEEKQAFELLETVNQKTDKLSSFCRETRITLKPNSSIQGIEYISVNEKTTTYNIGKKDMYYMAVSESTIKHEYETKEKIESGYVDGHAIYKKGTKYIKDEVTPEEYIKHLSNVSVNIFDIQIGMCETVTCSKNSDKSWSATYTDFTRQSLVNFANLLTMDILSLLGENIYLEDVEVEISANKDLLIEEMEINYEFGNRSSSESEPPVATMIIIFSDHDKVEKPEYDIDLESYDQMEDMLIANEALSAVLRHTSKSQYGISLTQKVETNEKTNEDIYEISAFTDDYGYAYSYTKKTDATDGQVYRYSNGEFTYGDEKKLYSKSGENLDLRAMGELHKKLISFDRVLTDIANVKVDPENKNKYILTAYVPGDLEALAPTDPEQNTLTITVTYEDGEITTIEEKHILSWRNKGAGSKNTVTTTLTYDLTYKPE